MAKQKGRAMLLKIGDGASPAIFTTLAGLLTKTLSIANELVDITNSDDAAGATKAINRTLLANAGVASITISATGIFDNDASVKLMEDLCYDGTLEEYQLLFGNTNVYQGVFQVSSFEYSGEHNNAQQYSLTLESSGVITPLR